MHSNGAWTNASRWARHWKESTDDSANVSPCTALSTRFLRAVSCIGANVLYSYRFMSLPQYSVSDTTINFPPHNIKLKEFSSECCNIARSFTSWSMISSCKVSSNIVQTTFARYVSKRRRTRFTGTQQQKKRIRCIEYYSRAWQRQGRPCCHLEARPTQQQEWPIEGLAHRSRVHSRLVKLQYRVRRRYIYETVLSKVKTTKEYTG